MRVSKLLSLLPLAALLPACSDDAPPTPDGVVVDPPSAQSVHTSKVRPPALSGGTLTVSTTLEKAVVADPDRDRIVVVDLATEEVEHVLALEAGDEPGRVAIDSSGRAHVALRGAGEIVSVDLSTGELLARRSVCGAPRGLVAFRGAEESASEETLLVACATGELVELLASPNGGDVARLTLEPDLRDIVVTGNGTRAGRRVLVSTFRTARVITLDANFEQEGSSEPAGYTHITSGRSFVPNVAWRMVPSGGGAMMIHQRAATVPIGDANQQVPQQYYASVDCGSSVVHGAATGFDANGERQGGSVGVGLAVLPVDVAVDPYGTVMAHIAAGNGTLHITPLGTNSDPCDSFGTGMSIPAGPEPVAVAFDGDGNVVVQTREPAALLRFDPNSWLSLGVISLGGESRRDTGYTMFHGNPDGATTISCASCHPEGGDDAHVWQFTDIGSRRTQTLQGDITDTAPFHWDGDLDDLDHLMSKVFVERMGGQEQSEDRVEALKGWLAGVPRIPGLEPADLAAVEHGRALFEDQKVACASCHSGEHLTNDETVDVGTGQAFQVPSLKGIRNRAPFMHDGCAPTLIDRFDPACGGQAHGDVSDLSEQDLEDLVAYMETL